jgi:hypothetical protein
MESRTDIRAFDATRPKGFQGAADSLLGDVVRISGVAQAPSGE